jgi:hypothetical protein
MELSGTGESQTVTLQDGNEMDTLRFAAFYRERSISVFDLRRRGLKQDMHELRSHISRELAATNGAPESRSLILDHHESKLALQALQWVIKHDDFSPDGTTGEMRQMLDSVELQTS